jgi:imidazolonepropionase-like amidohydrolase
MSSAGAIKDGVALVRDGKIEAVGRAADVRIPDGVKTVSAKVVTPGLIDAHTVVGLQGYRNEPREQDQLEKSAPIQPELRAIDAFNGQEKLVEYVRGFGITTIHTGPEPGALVHSLGGAVGPVLDLVQVCLRTALLEIVLDLSFETGFAFKAMVMPVIC